MVLPPSTLRFLIEKALHTRPDEIACGACFDALDRFAELHLAGKSAAEALPEVEAHLRGCPECLEEFEALLLVLREEARLAAEGVADV